MRETNKGLHQSGQMDLHSPFDALPVHWQVSLCTAFVLLTIGYAGILKRQSAPLDCILQYGVVTLEVPWTTAKAQSLRDDLGKEGIEVAREQIRLDFVFLILYPLALSLATALIAHKLGAQMLLYGALVSWAILLAAPLDAIENIAILKMLGGQTGAPWPQLSTICAALKFTLVFGALFYVVVGLLSMLVRCTQGCQP